MLLEMLPVPMPNKKITFKKGVNGTIYVYYTIRAYRNKNGNPTSDEVAIGKKDISSGMLIPNKKYYELFNIAPPASSLPQNSAVNSPHKITDYGNTFVLMRIAQEIGLAQTLEKCFPSMWPNILAVTFYMLCEGNVIMYLEDWFDVTNVPFSCVMDDKRCSEMFASISHEERMRFFEEWVKKRQEQEYIAYDVTSISTYSSDIDIAEWGYNRDEESLPQVNLGMYFGATSHLPVYYTMYSGSITDKSYLVFMLDSTSRLGINKVRFVMDRGFVTEDNVAYMADKGYQFIVPFPLDRVEATSIIETHGESIRKAANRIHEFDIYGTSFDYELYGVRMKIHLFFDPEKQNLDEKELYNRIARLSKELEKMSNVKRVTKRYTDFFSVEEEKPDISFEMDNEKIDARLKKAGYFVFLTTDLSCSPEELIRIYRGRDVIEKSFEQLKNGLEFRRLRTHLNKTTEGKVFVGFLALIMRSFLLNRVRTHTEDKRITFDKMLMELKKIKTVTMTDMQKILVPLTKTQKTILSILAIPHVDLINSVS
jgi:transposase